jgi:SAM-dependent methyltransferase
MTARAPLPAAVPAPFSQFLDQQVVHGNTNVVGTDPLTVTTPESQWSYALSYRPRAVMLGADDTLTSGIRFKLDLSVTKGRIGVGWTNPEDTAFITEKYAAGDRCQVRLTLPVGTRVGRLVFRNVAEGNVSSVFTMTSAEFETVAADRWTYPVSIPARDVHHEAMPTDGGAAVVFDTAAARDINAARIEWLEQSGLPVSGARVLDAGAGVGHFISFYADRGCTVVCIDGRSENIGELKRRHPNVDARVADLQTIDTRDFGLFDVIHCFGLLYHLDSPVAALRRLHAMCGRLLILETMVCDSSSPVSVLVDETKAASQAMDALGCRPSPSFIALALNRVGFEYVYGAAVPPRHPDFQFSWKDNLETTRDGVPLRCVIVASRTPLELTSLIPLVEP